MAFYYTSNIACDVICAWYGKGNIKRNAAHVRYMHVTNCVHVDLQFICTNLFFRDDAII